MVNISPLELARDVKLGTVHAPTDLAYIAVRSESTDAIPYISWTVLEVVEKTQGKSDVLVVNPSEFSLKYLKPAMRLLWKPVEPPLLRKVVLTAPARVYKTLEKSQDTLRQSLPHFVVTGAVLSDLGCSVRACEPADQGLVPSDAKDLEKFTVTVIESEETDFKATHDESPASVDVESFLEPGLSSLQLNVSPLARPVPLSSIMPPPSGDADPENFAFVNMPQLAKLGIFSGDFVRLKSDKGKSRLVHLFSFPESNEIIEDSLYMSPITAHNLGAPATVEVSPVVVKEQPYEIAKEFTLSRVSSPAASEKATQAAFYRGLKKYFSEPKTRVVKNGDLIPVPFNAAVARLLGAPSTPATSSSPNGSASTDDEPDIDLLTLQPPTAPDTVVWFHVNGLPSDDQYAVTSSHTRIVQAGLVQTLAPSSRLRWQRYLGLPQPFRYLDDPQHFEYAQFLHKLLQASTTARGASLRTTVLLKSSKRGAGKSTLLQSICAELGMHTMMLDANDLIGDSDSKTLGLLRARLERAASTNPCLVCLKHLDALAKKNDVDGKDTPLINGIVDILDEIAKSKGNDENIIFAATVGDADVLAESVRNKFKFEVDVTVPTERERRRILSYLTSAEGGFNDIGNLVSKLSPEVFTGFKLRGDVLVENLALQTAGLAPPDLLAIVRAAKQAASADTNENVVLCSGGRITVTPDVIEKAVSEARGKFSDSIGAPKIPNVGWKDVGGLDMVKGEILDTIEMPLKHPELFASGLKKRSGILFYGPPGTGKTLLAKAIATNFSLNFFSVKGPELLNMYIGESEANVRRVFQKARDAKPCVVFFDELDSVAPKRGNKGDSGGVMDRIVSQLLAELDGMSEGSDGVFVVGATNRPDLLDEALLRPGRFDKMLYLGVSDTHDKQRTILEALTRKFELDPKVDLGKIAEKCPFTFTGADFYAMSSDAMLNAMTRTAGEIDAKIAKHNAENPDKQVSIRRWFESIATEDDVKVLVADEDFVKAQNELVPSVSADELQHYLRVRQTFEGTA